MIAINRKDTNFNNQPVQGQHPLVSPHQCWDPWEPGQVHQFFQRRHCPTKQKASRLCQTHSGGSRNPTRKLWSWIRGKARWQSERQPKRKTLEGGKLVRMIRLSNPPKLAVVWPPNGLTSFNFSAMVLDHVSHIFNMFNIPKIAHEKPTQKACCVLDPFISDFPWFSPGFLATKSWPWPWQSFASLATPSAGWRAPPPLSDSTGRWAPSAWRKKTTCLLKLSDFGGNKSYCTLS